MNNEEPVSAFAIYSTQCKFKSGFSNVKKLKGKKKVSSYREKKNKIRKSTLNKKNNTTTKEDKLREIVSNQLEFEDSIIKKSDICRSKELRKSNNIPKSVKLLNSRNIEKIRKSRRPEKINFNRNSEEVVDVNSGRGINYDQYSDSARRKAIDRNDKSKKKEKSKPEVEIQTDHVNPLNESKWCFEWLIFPLNFDDFFKNTWEQQPVHIKRNDPDYYKFLMSTPILDTILRENHVLFTKNIDITSYSDGVRETHNPPGRALPNIVWDYYENGCSIRMLNPQTFIPQLHELNAVLQELFDCFVGANSYLTPPNSQGFAPHFDDIEAFILQIEGKKRWRLYKPSDEDYLARYSSKNFNQSEIGEPFMDTILNTGDLLYLPRGTIHQGETLNNIHSLHITLSVYQKNSWTDLMEKLLPKALERASKFNYRFREGLPLGFFKKVGFVNSGDKNSNAELYLEKIKDLIIELVNHIDINEVADEMAKEHIHDCLPPVFWKNSILQNGRIVKNEGTVEKGINIEPDTRIRLSRFHCIRLMKEENAFRIYYSTENSKEYHEYDLQFFEIEFNQIPLVKEIIRQYPSYIRVGDLPPFDDTIDIHTKVQIVQDLWERCLIITEDPLR